MSSRLAIRFGWRKLTLQVSVPARHSRARVCGRTTATERPMSGYFCGLFFELPDSRKAFSSPLSSAASWMA